MNSHKWLVFAAALITWTGTTIGAHADKEFKMSYERIAAMTVDQFMQVYDRSLGMHNAPGGYFGYEYRDGMEYYADSLRERTDHRARRLPRIARARWQRFESAMDVWFDLFFKWYDDSEGTAWWDQWVECDVCKEQLNNSVENAATNRRRPHQLRSTILHEFPILNIAVLSPTMKDEPDGYGKLSYEARVKRMTQAISELKQAYISLRVDADSQLQGCIEHIRKRAAE